MSVYLPGNGRGIRTGVSGQQTDDKGGSVADQGKSEGTFPGQIYEVMFMK